MKIHSTESIKESSKESSSNISLAKLYAIKRIPYVILTITAICVVASIAVFIVPAWFDILCIKTSPEHIWQYASGIFIHGVNPRWFMWMHLGMNLLALLPFGILVEKMIGSKRTLFLFFAEWIVSVVLFQILTAANPHTTVGISTVAYAFATVALYYAYLVRKRNRKAFFKQPLSIFYLVEGLGMLSLLNPMAGMASLLMHFSGVIIGIIYIIIDKRFIHSKLEDAIKVINEGE
jgi:membrane associated rhomboid family serine protease